MYQIVINKNKHKKIIHNVSLSKPSSLYFLNLNGRTNNTKNQGVNNNHPSTKNHDEIKI